jgi:hypothetical protein
LVGFSRTLALVAVAAKYFRLERNQKSSQSIVLGKKDLFYVEYLGLSTSGQHRYRAFGLSHACDQRQKVRE